MRRISFGARTYNASIGRFDGVDPLAEISERFSPFVYANNNPLSFVDPDGMASEEAKDYTYSDGYSTLSAKNSTGSVGFNGAYSNTSNNSNTEGDDAAAASQQLQMMGTGGGDDKDKNKKKDDGNSAKSNCPTCLDPSTVGNNMFGLTYPGGNNPKNYSGDYDYSYQPTNIAEYPAIGHDRRYDRLKIEGVSGLFTDTRAIGADWKFVSEELSIAQMPFLRPKERLQALGLAVGLGIAATPKTMYKYLIDTNAIFTIDLDYRISSIGVTNRPDTPKRK